MTPAFYHYLARLFNFFCHHNKSLSIYIYMLHLLHINHFLKWVYICVSFVMKSKTIHMEYVANYRYPWWIISSPVTSEVRESVEMCISINNLLQFFIFLKIKNTYLFYILSSAVVSPIQITPSCPKYIRSTRIKVL